MDNLCQLRDRFHGLRCAIQGASISNDADRNGLLQLADDVAEDLTSLTALMTSRKHDER